MVRYLVCVDGSNHAWQAFHIATSLMRHDGVDLLTVVTAIKENDDPDAAASLLSSFVTDYFHEHGPRIEWVSEVVIKNDHRRKAVVDYIHKEGDFDIVFVGSRGSGRSLGSVLHGTFSSYLLEHVENTHCAD
jgi:nucleotide-binding universal stress UspA family protein